MNTEELTGEERERPMHFDAHEFDGLRDALEKEAEGVFAGRRCRKRLYSGAAMRRYPETVVSAAPLRMLILST